jgi:hypothetical protein
MKAGSIHQPENQQGHQDDHQNGHAGEKPDLFLMR